MIQNCRIRAYTYVFIIGYRYLHLQQQQQSNVNIIITPIDTYINTYLIPIRSAAIFKGFCVGDYLYRTRINDNQKLERCVIRFVNHL